MFYSKKARKSRICLHGLKVKITLGVSLYCYVSHSSCKLEEKKLNAVTAGPNINNSNEQHLKIHIHKKRTRETLIPQILNTSGAKQCSTCALNSFSKHLTSSLILDTRVHIRFLIFSTLCVTKHQTVQLYYAADLQTSHLNYFFSAYLRQGKSNAAGSSNTILDLCQITRH